MSTYLMHHGIKGQKWGVRRFQDAAGNLTAAGKKRYRDYVDTRKNQKAYEKDIKKRANADRKEYRSARRNAYGILPRHGRSKEENKEAETRASEARKKYRESSSEYRYYRDLKKSGFSTYDRAQARKNRRQFAEDGKAGKYVGKQVGLALGAYGKNQVKQEIGKKVRGAVIKAAVGYAAVKLVKRYYGKKADTIGLPGPVNNKARDIIDVLPNGKVKVSRAVESVTVSQVYEAVKDFANDIRGK